MTRGKMSILQTKRALSVNGTKDLDTLSDLSRSMPWVCLHKPKPHKWWELWGLVEKFPLAAEAEIIGPRFSRSFGIHISSQVLIFTTPLTRQRLWKQGRLTTWYSLTYFRQVRNPDPFQVRWWFFFRSYTNIFFMLNTWCHVITNMCPLTVETAVFIVAGVWSDLFGCQDFLVCVCLEVKSWSFRNSDLKDAELLLSNLS